MGGFTAINANPVADHTPTASLEALNAASRRVKTVDGLLDRLVPKTMVSDYLGRGDPNGVSAEVKQNSGALRGPGTKKAIGKRKKRASDTTSENDPKRRKTNDVDSGSPVTKYASQTNEKADGDLDIRKQTESRSSTESKIVDGTQLTGVKISKCTLGNPEGDAAMPTAAQSVQILAPTTSISTFQLSSLQTSLDAVRSSGGYTTTVYQGAKPPKSIAPSAHHSRPLQRSGVVSYTGASSERETNVSMPRRRERNSTPRELRTSGGESQRASTALNLPTSKDPSRSEPNVIDSTVSENERADIRHSSAILLSDDHENFFGDDDMNLIEVLASSSTVGTQARATYEKSSFSTVKAGRQTVSGKPSEALASKPDVQKGNMASTPTSGEEFMQLDDEGDFELLELTKTAEALAVRSRSPLPLSGKKLLQRDVDETDDLADFSFFEANKKLLGMPDENSEYFKYPQNRPLHNFSRQNTDTKNCTVKLTTSNPIHQMKPIVRDQVPSPILDRSPLAGATNTTLLRTCFRLGEALNTAAHAVRTNQNILFELYARVTSSYREGRKQHFQFRDLYHDRPPCLEGEGQIWRLNKVGDADWKGFVGEWKDGIMCRVVGRMRREESVARGGRVRWMLEVLSIWEAGWEDVEFVAGIYAERREGSVGGVEA